MFFNQKNLKGENNNPLFRPLFNIFLHTQSIVCVTVHIRSMFRVLGIYNFAFHVKFAKLRTLWNTKSSYASHNFSFDAYFIHTFAVGDQSRLVWFFWRGSWTSSCRRLTNIDWGRGRTSITYEIILKITFIY